MAGLATGAVILVLTFRGLTIGLVDGVPIFTGFLFSWRFVVIGLFNAGLSGLMGRIGADDSVRGPNVGGPTGIARLATDIADAGLTEDWELDDEIDR